MFDYCTGGMPSFYWVSWCHDGKRWKHAHDTYILGGMMSDAHCAVSESASNGHDLYVHVMVADIIADLLQASHRREVGNRVCKDNLPAWRPPCRHAYHVLLRHAGIYELPWQLVHEGFDHRKSKITGNQHDTIVLPGQFKKCLKKGRSHLFLSSSSIAISKSFPPGARQRQSSF